MSIDLKFVELTADVLDFFYKIYTASRLVLAGSIYLLLH